MSGSSSGISGSSSGGNYCKPLPGCTSETVCPAGDGCNTCYCGYDGSWECTQRACPVEAGTCPVQPPTAGTGCYPSGEYCDYGSGCGSEACDCANGTWECSYAGCPPPPPQCPPGEPFSGSSCPADGQYCYYGNTCGTDTCDCSSGAWQCSVAVCPPPPPACPTSEPPNGMACMNVGTLCDYPINNSVCQYDQCECDQSGTWGCTMAGCAVDAGTWGG